MHGCKERPSFEAHEPMAQEEKERGAAEAHEEGGAGYSGGQPPSRQGAPVLAFDFGLDFRALERLTPILKKCLK